MPIGSSGLESRFADNISRLLDRMDYRLANSDEQREAIFRLRYQAYIRDGAISPNFSGAYSDAYDQIGNVYLLGLHIEDELASSIRLHVAVGKDAKFPALEVFADALQPELDAGKVIVDATCFVADEKLSRLHRGLPYATFRLCMLAARYFDADHLLAAVRAEHRKFYEHALNHRLIGETRPHPLLAKPIYLMTLDYPAAGDDLNQRYPFFCSTFFERRMLFERSIEGPLQPEASSAASRHVLNAAQREPRFVERFQTLPTAH